MKHLLEMGFEEKDVIDALRVTRNDGNAAVRLYLISNSGSQEMMEMLL